MSEALEVRRKAFVYLSIISILITMFALFSATPVNANETGNVAETVYDVVYEPSELLINGNDSVEVNLRNQLDIQLVDQFGQPYNATGDMAVWFSFKDDEGTFLSNVKLYDSLIGGQEFDRDWWSGQYCVTISKDQNTATVYLIYDMVGNVNVKVNATVDEMQLDGSKTVKINEAKQIRLELFGWEALKAGKRVELVLRTSDQYGNPVEQQSDLSVALATSSEKGKFFATADDSDTVALSGVTIPAGKSEVRCYYYDSEAGYWEISASSGDLQNASRFIDVYPDKPTDIKINSKDVYVGKKVAITLELVDQFGNHSYSETPLTVVLSGSGNSKFFDWNGNMISQATIPGWWESDVTVLYSNDTLGTATITATTTGLSKTIEVNVIEFPDKFYYDRVLRSGWNTLSIPVALKDQSLKTILGDDLENAEAVFAFKDGKFEKVTDLDTEVQVLDAVFVKVSEGKEILINFGDNVSDLQTAPASKELQAGWNFVGPAVWNVWYDEWWGYWGLQTGMNAEQNFASISGKYSQVVSPNYNQSSWIYVAGEEYGPWVDAGCGYWVFMKDDGTLAGFSYTPIEPYIWEEMDSAS